MEDRFARGYKSQIEIEGLVIQTFNNVDGIYGQSRETIEQTDENGDIQEFKGRKRTKHVTLALPENGIVSPYFAEWLSSGDNKMVNFHCYDHDDNFLFTAIGTDCYPVDTGMSADKNTSDMSPVSVEVVVGKWLGT